MKRALAWGAALLFAWSAAAQDHPTPQDLPGAPDVPAGEAAIQGRVLNEQRDGVADVGVILYSLRPDGEPGLRQARTDAKGAFRFEGVSGDPEVVYLVGTRVGGVPFGARVVFEAGQTLRDVEVEVTQPSLEVGRVRAGEPVLRFERGCSHLRVHHEIPLTNPTQRVVFVPPDQREGAQPLFELLLPEQASEIETPLGAGTDGFERSGRQLRFFGPLYPGDTTVEFSYGVPLAPETALSIGFPGGAPGVRVLAPAAGARVSGEGLREEPAAEGPGGPQRAWQAGAVAPGGTLQLSLALDAPAADGAVSIGEARFWLELDDAALDVSEAWLLRVEGPAPAESAGAPLLCIPLPPGAESLRFSNASLAMGLSRDPDGALALSGPVPAGDSTLSLRYQLPASPGEVTFDRAFQSGVDLLTVLVADTGIVPHAERLHRRRPVRTEDRSYLHLEGFGIAPGEHVEVALEPLAQRSGLPSLATSGVVLLVAAGALFYLMAPLRGPEREAGETAGDADLAQGPASRLAQEREAVYAAIDDLDEDFDTGKLSPEDHERMRAELRARAVALLQAEREDAAKPAEAVPDAPAAPFCTACGTRSQPGDRFCSQCGTALRSAVPAGGSAAS